MLANALKTIRSLCDEAIAEDQVKHAASLSRLSSTLHSTHRYRTQVEETHLTHEDLRQVITELVTGYVCKAEQVLSAQDFEQVKPIMIEAIPAPLADDEDCLQLMREFHQVELLFNQAVEGRLISEAVRLGNLLAMKCKALTKLQLEVGAFVHEQQIKEAEQAAADANLKVRDMVSPNKFAEFMDELLTELGVTYG